MTAEIGMLNKYAAVLAADSAVTVNGGSNKEKVYNSANKLFMLSEKHPIGIMIYGSATFLGIPWETIVKQYRKELSTDKFDYVSEYVENFFKYLQNDTNLNHTYDTKSFIVRKFYSFLQQIENSLNEEETAKVCLEKLSNILTNEYSTIDELEKIDNDYFFQFNDDFNLILDNNPIMDDGSIDNEEVIQLFYKYIKSSYLEAISGVVISGFGEKEIFPTLISYDVEGMINKIIKKVLREDASISSDMTASIHPFAQTHMVRTFINGANPDLVYWARNELKNNIVNMTTEIATSIQEKTGLDDTTLTTVLNKIGNNMLEQYLKKLDKYKQEKHIMPVVDTVAMLGKEDLAAMAENLVGISSLEKRMSLDTETVGGPIDVAVISKGDGFIWYKRKHYFDAKQNNHYFKK